jgi:hypothetical protein
VEVIDRYSVTQAMANSKRWMVFMVRMDSDLKEELNKLHQIVRNNQNNKDEKGLEASL